MQQEEHVHIPKILTQTRGLDRWTGLDRLGRLKIKGSSPQGGWFVPLKKLHHRAFLGILHVVETPMETMKRHGFTGMVYVYHPSNRVMT